MCLRLDQVRVKAENQLLFWGSFRFPLVVREQALVCGPGPRVVGLVGSSHLPFTVDSDPADEAALLVPFLAPMKAPATDDHLSQLGVRMKALFVSALTAISLTGCDATSRAVGPRSIGVNASVTEQSFTPLDLYFLNKCTGDRFLVTGTVHTVYTGTVAMGGRFHSGIHINFQSAGGENLTSGIRYRVISNQEGTSTYGRSPSERTSLLIFKLVGSGPGDNYTLRTQAHLTVNANGEATASFDEGEVVCQ